MIDIGFLAFVFSFLFGQFIWLSREEMKIDMSKDGGPIKKKKCYAPRT